jgi:hypothetical protein
VTKWPISYSGIKARALHLSIPRQFEAAETIIQIFGTLGLQCDKGRQFEMQQICFKGIFLQTERTSTSPRSVLPI